MWGEKKVIVGLFSILALAAFAVAGDTGTPVLAQGAPPDGAKILVAEEMWLDLDIFQGRIDPKHEFNDSFVMKGSFNLEPGLIDPATSDVTINAENWQLALPAVQFQKKGNTNKYMAKGPGFTAQIEYWVKGSSRCKFTLICVKQDLQGARLHYPNITVELKIGATFDESFTAIMEDHGTAFKMGPDAEGSLFKVKSLHLVKNRKVVGRDSFVLKARIVTDGEFDPSTNDVMLWIAGQSVTIPAGSITIPPDATKMTYNGTLAGGEKVRVSVNFNTGMMTMGATNVDLDSLTNPTTMAFTITGIPGALWAPRMWLVENPGHTSYKY